MRLLNTQTLQLEPFFGAETDIPPYAILSHTWEKVEIVFQDIKEQATDELKRNPAFAKIAWSCQQALCDGFEYIWIDTCCIDKSSSAELSEAISSMFKWYQQSSLCYVFLKDFKARILKKYDTSFFSCRWFERGWTLQELIAPRNVHFFDKNWKDFGTRDGNLLDRLCTRTRICPEVFTEDRCRCMKAVSSSAVRNGLCMECEYPDTLTQMLDTFAVSIKMSWASSRVTTRKEDAAYCLVGLFNINIPMLYGEGDKAFFRLQDAILRQSRDQSILLWRTVPSRSLQELAMGCLAPAAEYFRDPLPIVRRRVFLNLYSGYDADFLGNTIPMEITDMVIKVNIWICPCAIHVYDLYRNEHIPYTLWLGILDLSLDSDPPTRPGILFEKMDLADIYRRVYHQIVVPIDTTKSTAGFHYSLDGKLHKRVSVSKLHKRISVRKSRKTVSGAMLSRRELVIDPTIMGIEVCLDEGSERYRHFSVKSG